MVAECNENLTIHYASLLLITMPLDYLLVPFVLALVFTRTLFTLPDASSSLYVARCLFFSLSQPLAHESWSLESQLAVPLSCPIPPFPAQRCTCSPPSTFTTFTLRFNRHNKRPKVLLIPSHTCLLSIQNPHTLRSLKNVCFNT